MVVWDSVGDAGRVVVSCLASWFVVAMKEDDSRITAVPLSFSKMKV